MGGIECDVCFKCGSTTHKYNECKKKGSFVNAKCFICGVVGHLSAQCPENAHGVYPEVRNLPVVFCLLLIYFT